MLRTPTRRQATNVPDLNASDEEHSSYQSAIQRTSQMLHNAKMASLAFKFFDESSELDRKLSPTKRAHFKKAYYGVMAMVLLSCEGIPESLIASWDMLDFQRVHEVLSFLTDRPPKGLGSEGSITALKLKVALCRVRLLDQVILAAAPSVYLSKPPQTASCYFITETTNSLGGAHLADILPLLPAVAMAAAAANEISLANLTRCMRFRSPDSGFGEIPDALLTIKLASAILT